MAIADHLKELATAPSQKEAYDLWLQMKDVIAFLRGNAGSDEFVIYAAHPYPFLNTVFVPKTSMQSSNRDELASWDLNPWSTWEISVAPGETFDVSISGPLADCRTKIFRGGEQLVFGRSFQGRLGNKHYYEIFQKYLHLLGLHFLAERNAYCRLDEHGDVEEVIRVLEIDEKSGREGPIIIIKRVFLDRYALLTDSVIIRLFDFTRFRQSAFHGWSQ